MNTIVRRSSGFYRLLYDNKYFFLPFACFLGVSALVLLLFGNTGLFYCINHCYSGFADFWFLNLTKLGDGTIAFILIVILMWVSMRHALALLIITLLISILIVFLKNFVFADYYRPLAFLGEEFIRLVPGYTPPKYHTFPSGHTATAFSIYLYSSFLIRQNAGKFSLFVIAFMIAYSRVYLSAHFPADIIAGSLLAVCVTVPAHLYVMRMKFSWLDRKIVFNPFIPRQQTI